MGPLLLQRPSRWCVLDFLLDLCQRKSHLSECSGGSALPLFGPGRFQKFISGSQDWSVWIFISFSLFAAKAGVATTFFKKDPSGSSNFQPDEREITLNHSARQKWVKYPSVFWASIGKMFTWEATVWWLVAESAVLGTVSGIGMSVWGWECGLFSGKMKTSPIGDQLLWHRRVCSQDKYQDGKRSLSAQEEFII